MELKRTEIIKTICAIILFISLIFSVGYAIYNIVISPNEGALHVKSDYTLILIQCILGLAVMALPGAFEKKFSLTIPNKMYVFYFVFLYCAIYLGEVKNFYYEVPYWDSILHCFSGAMLGLLGFLVVRLMNESQNVSVQISPVFVAIFAFCFALALGAVWEIYEFAGDSLFGLNMQKHMCYDGTPLIGHAALSDTMKDIIIDAFSAFAVSLIGYLYLKRQMKK